MKNVIIIVLMLISFISVSQNAKETIRYHIGNENISYQIEEKSLSPDCGISPNDAYPILAYYEKNKADFENWIIKKDIFSGDSTLLKDIKLIVTPKRNNDYFEIIGENFSVRIELTNSFILKEEDDLILFATIKRDNSVLYCEIKK